MAYSKTTWANGDVITATKLNNMESGIETNDTNITTNADDIAALDTRLTTAEGNITDLTSDLNEVTTTESTEVIDDSTNLATTLERGYYTTSGGSMTFNNNASFSHMKVPVTAGTKYQINYTHNVYTTSQFPALGVFVDSNGDYINLIANVYGSVPSEEPYDITAPSDSAYMYLSTDYVYTDTDIATTVYAYTTTTQRFLDNDALVTAPVYYSDLATTGKKIKLIAGVIRNTGDGWEFIDDSGHNPLNLSAVSVNDDGQIEITYDFTASKVLSLIVTPDETFAGTYTCGASVGLSSSLINIYTLPKSVGGLVRYSSSSDSWSYSSNSDFTGATFASTGNLTLSHEDLTGYPLSDIYSVSADGNGGNVQIVSVGYTSVIVRLFDSSGSVITSPSNNTSVYVIRHLNSRFIDANDVVSSAGNLWIYGVMEVE